MKRLWWSITNLKKYDEMMNLGLKKAIKYILTLIAIFSFILAIVFSYLQINIMNEFKQYINEKLPEFTISKGEEDTYKLDVESGDAIILEDEILKQIFGSNIVVNTNLDEKDAINEYYKLATDNKTCIIFIQNECIIISSKYNIKNDLSEGMAKYTYKD